MAYSSDSPTRASSVHPGDGLPAVPARALSGYDEWVDVEVHADPGLDVIALVVDGTQQLMWHQDVARLALALASAGGNPQWCALHSILLVPGGFNSPAGSSFFCLAATERAHRCPETTVRAEAPHSVPQPASRP
ncbi:hypothetical protein H9639_09980 [Arthrobacter sp. Sa2CUA1]|uniref:Uncharacterized protein n=1 Tax=Arthrobacter gallicola TaxID=2762225 RepID=A0ABR8USW3_9MICC|nr:hypothetical protein [Arthrobacter gallicola]MBD7995624.1 hypothetical protein [Arthrobacter gallicola]